METTTFTALCERAGRWWTIRVPQVDGLTAQVRSLDQAEIVTRQLIARTLAIPAEAIRVDVIPDAPVPVAQALKQRHVARQAADAAGRATREALEGLARDGVAFHDAATMLGLSPAEIEVYGPRSAPAAGQTPEQSGPNPLQLAGPLAAAGAGRLEAFRLVAGLSRPSTRSYMRSRSARASCRRELTSSFLKTFLR
ncbi:MAG TPA: hypothetical protein VGG83_24450 [Trebonia sp.]